MTPDEIRLSEYDGAAEHVTEHRGRSFTSFRGWTMLNADDYSELLCSNEAHLKAIASIEAQQGMPAIEASRETLALKVRVSHLESAVLRMVEACGLQMYPRSLRKELTALVASIRARSKPPHKEKLP